MSHRKGRGTRRQQGVTTVEVAIVGMLALLVIFAVLEVGRVLFVLNALEEGTRRGVRVAVVCPVGDPTPITEVAIFNGSGGGMTSSLVGGLTTGHVRVEYLGATGEVLGDPENGDFGRIAFVRVRMEGFEHRLLIPLFMTTFTMPEFATVLPRESLGVTREEVSPC